jgi:hypothetical protein
MGHLARLLGCVCVTASARRLARVVRHTAVDPTEARNETVQLPVALLDVEAREADMGRRSPQRLFGQVTLPRPLGPVRRPVAYGKTGVSPGMSNRAGSARWKLT